MKTPAITAPPRWVWLVGIVLVLAVAGISWPFWFPATNQWVTSTLTTFRGGDTEGQGHEHGASGHSGDAHEGGHSHAGHDEATSLHLSEQARLNIGLTEEQIQPIELRRFEKSITVPAVIEERPGRSRVQVAAPMTGIVTHVHAVQGEAVKPGSLLVELRLTHEDLVQSQKEFVSTLEELDVEKREIERLREVTESGAVAGRVLLERQYAQDKLKAKLRTQREALLLHGLSEDHVTRIENERKLLRELKVFAPTSDEHDHPELNLSGKVFQKASFVQENEAGTSEGQKQGPLILHELNVHKGQTVTTGETMCVLTDYEELYIEGLAFEQDLSQLQRASGNGWKVDAIFDEPNSQRTIVEGLEIAYLENQVMRESRTLPFYVRLHNTVTKDRQFDGNRYIEWRYLPGQRLQLRVPVEVWSDQIVLPVEAVARQGAESYVFQQNGDHFDRVAVHVKYRDQFSAVIANDGALYPGDVVAMTGAHQMQMALDNKAGGGADPHAGHNH